MGEPADVNVKLALLEADQKRLEAEMLELKADLKAASDRLAYYDRFALKWGGFLLGITALGAALAAGVDKVKEKILAWFF